MSDKATITVLVLLTYGCYGLLTDMSDFRLFFTFFFKNGRFSCDWLQKSGISGHLKGKLVNMGHLRILRATWKCFFRDLPRSQFLVAGGHLKKKKKKFNFFLYSVIKVTFTST